LEREELEEMGDGIGFVRFEGELAFFSRQMRQQDTDKLEYYS